MNISPAIVVLAYARPSALKRLLFDLESADYSEPPVLIISVEGGADQKVRDVISAFSSKKMRVRVIQRSTRLGLRDHVIACGDLSKDYGSIVLLEDDVTVDRYFHKYAVEALSFYLNDPQVSGIALYSYEVNELSGIPFRPMHNGYDTYPMRVPCSSGQCWTHHQWLDFRSWYCDKSSADLENLSTLPEVAKNWPESSWKKYFFAYMVVMNKWFIYPYQAFSTNVSDHGGTHLKFGSNVHQVSLPNRERPIPEFKFAPLNHQEVIYDAFMEPCGDFIQRALGLSQEDVEIDIQGIKPKALIEKKAYVVTNRKTRQKMRLFSLSFRPPELNLAYPPINGQCDFWLSRVSDLSLSQCPSRTVKELSYYAGFEITSRGILLSIIKALPKKIVNKIKSVLPD